jgi:hypothetical protein
MRRTGSSQRLPYLVGAAALAFGIGAVACGDDGSTTLIGANHGTAGSGPSQTNVAPTSGRDDAGVVPAADAAPPESKAEQLFRALQTNLVATCGGTDGACHVNGSFLNGQTPVWLGAPDAYVSAKAYPGIITADPYASKLLLKGPHEGPSFAGPNADLGTQVTAWLTEEAALLVSVALPATTPIAVENGPTVIDISSVASGMTGAKISFTAALSNGILTLTNLQVQAPVASGLHIAHPVFAAVPPTGATIPDPVDSFSNVDQTVSPAESTPLGTGTLVLSSFPIGGELEIQFNTLAPVAVVVADGGAGSGGCKSVAAFVANAVPAIQQNQCLGCHGTTSGSGYSSLDLTQVGVDNAAACAQALTKVDLQTPAQSDIILAPTGQLANHPFQNASATYSSMMLAWISTE